MSWGCFTEKGGPPKSLVLWVSPDLYADSQPWWTFRQPVPKYHTKGCSRSFADSPGARTLVFAAFEPFHGCEFRASIARTPFCAILRRSPISDVFFFPVRGREGGDRGAGRRGVGFF